MNVLGETGTMTAEECWVLLEDESFGRLAYRLVDEVHIVPIDYATSGRVVHVRTQSGNKLLAAPVDLERDVRAEGRGEHAAWSVVVRGHLRRLEPTERPPAVPEPRPWVMEVASEVVELVPDAVEGRRFSWG